MAVRRKILLLDDEQEVLDLYRELLKQIPSQPEIYSCNTGARAIALLESEPFALLITDLNMPKMDGLQVLSIVRRRFPQVRVIVLTSVVEEQYRSRAYALGVDLFWQKPSNGDEAKFFQDCIESMLQGEATGGFRGVQSKSLVDLIQFECMSRNSCVLRITQGPLDGRIWVQEGEVIDATAGDLVGEPAFREIFSWKNGHFEIQPADPGHERHIFGSYQGLLLDTAQALDEAKAKPGQVTTTSASDTSISPKPAASPLADLAREGVTFIVAIPGSDKEEVKKWGMDNVDPIAAWARQTERRLRALGEKLGVGELGLVHGQAPQEHVALAPRNGRMLCAGFRQDLSKEQVHQNIKEMTAKWAS